MHHEPCPACGSSDALGRYTDGHGYCHKCEHWEPGDGSASTPSRSPKGSRMDTLLTGTVQAPAVDKTCTLGDPHPGRFAGTWRRRCVSRQGRGAGMLCRGSCGLPRASAPVLANGLH